MCLATVSEENALDEDQVDTLAKSCPTQAELKLMKSQNLVKYSMI